MSAPAWQAIDPAVLLAAVGGDAAAFGALSDTFLDIAPGMYRALLLALDRADRRAVAQASHALRGSTVLVGAHALSAILRQLEACAGQADGPPLVAPPGLAPGFALVMHEVAASRDAAAAGGA
jgi:HPt (histidine-containing phosphotransfer) domain-containing protein